jgi:hypothetical protein
MLTVASGKRLREAGDRELRQPLSQIWTTQVLVIPSGARNLTQGDLAPVNLTGAILGETGMAAPKVAYGGSESSTVRSLGSLRSLGMTTGPFMRWVGGLPVES